MTVICIEYKKFSEHDAEAQARIIEKNRDFNAADSFWYESAIETIKEAGSIIGIECENVFFSLGYSQSDYCAIQGYYCYKKGAEQAVKAEFPAWHDLHAIARQLQREQCRAFYGVCSHVSVRRDNMAFETRQEKGDMRASNDVEQLLRDFASMAYCLIRDEYEALTSDDALAEYFADSDYEFNDEGELL